MPRNFFWTHIATNPSPTAWNAAFVDHCSEELRSSFKLLFRFKGPSTLATLFNHMWPRIVADPSTLGQRSLCGGDELQPVAHLSHKLQCARQSLKIMVSYGNKYPRHNARPHVVEQSGQCARALLVIIFT